MARAFTVEEFLDWVDTNDAFDIRATKHLPKRRIAISLANGVEFFNEALWDMAIEEMGFNESWVEVYDTILKKPF